jgi:hypothetical protein
MSEMRSVTTQLCAERGCSHRKRLEKNALSVKTKSGAGTSKVTEKSSQAADAFDANETNISCMLTSNIPRSFSATIQINGSGFHSLDDDSTLDTFPLTNL